MNAHLRFRLVEENLGPAVLEFGLVIDLHRSKCVARIRTSHPVPHPQKVARVHHDHGDGTDEKGSLETVPHLGANLWSEFVTPNSTLSMTLKIAFCSLE